VYKIRSNVSPKYQKKNTKKTVVVKLLPPYNQGTLLRHLLVRIDRLRKQPPNKTDMLHSNLVADIPILAKL